MNSRRLEYGAWALGFLLAAMGGFQYSLGPAGSSTLAAAGGSPTPPARPIPESLQIWAPRIAERNPFRLGRRPANVRLGQPEQLELANPPRPVLLLLGTIGGPPWRAVIGGLPARTVPLIVRAGERHNGVTVLSVTRDSAVVEGFDTTWVLVLRRP